MIQYILGLSLLVLQLCAFSCDPAQTGQLQQSPVLTPEQRAGIAAYEVLSANLESRPCAQEKLHWLKQNQGRVEEVFGRLATQKLPNFSDFQVPKGILKKEDIDLVLA